MPTSTTNKNHVSVSGHLVQYSWMDELMFVRNPSPESGDEIYHRPMTIEIPVKTLKFHPEDDDAKKPHALMVRLSALEYKKTRLYKEIQETDEVIQSLLAIDAPAPDPEF